MPLSRGTPTPGKGRMLAFKHYAAESRTPFGGFSIGPIGPIGPMGPMGPIGRSSPFRARLNGRRLRRRITALDHLAQRSGELWMLVEDSFEVRLVQDEQVARL